jgi:hypothetical protein
MSINQLLIDTVKPLDIVVDTINGLPYPQEEDIFTTFADIGGNITAGTNVDEVLFATSQVIIEEKPNITINNVEYKVHRVFSEKPQIKTTATITGPENTFTLNFSIPNIYDGNTEILYNSTSCVGMITDGVASIIPFNGWGYQNTSDPNTFGMVFSIGTDAPQSFKMVASSTYYIKFDTYFANPVIN